MKKEQYLIGRVDQGEPLCHFQSLHGFLDIVGPDDFCTAGHSGQGGTEGARQPVVGIGCTAEVIDPGLTGSPKKDAPAGGDEFIQFPHQSEVVLEGFTKPDARINPQPRELELFEGLYFLVKKSTHLFDHIFVGGGILHIFGGALGMH